MALLRNVLDMLHNIEPNCYLNDIVVPLLNNTKTYYSEIAPILYLENPCPDDYMNKVPSKRSIYMLVYAFIHYTFLMDNVTFNKVDEFLRLESERASHYSPFDIKQMLYEVCPKFQFHWVSWYVFKAYVPVPQKKHMLHSFI